MSFFYHLFLPIRTVLWQRWALGVRILLLISSGKGKGADGREPRSNPLHIILWNQAHPAPSPLGIASAAIVIAIAVPAAPRPCSRL